MGAWNFGRSDIITLAFLPDELNVTDIMRINEVSEEEAQQFANDILDYETYEHYETAEKLINQISFDKMEVSLESGYYEGFQLKIKVLEEHFKTEVNTKLKPLLRKLVKEAGMLVCYPNWGTKWETRKNSLTLINNL